MPEGTLPLAEAIICVCESEKSNSVVIARDEAERAVQTVKKEAVPMYLRDVNYKQEKISGYKYPHDYGGYVEQQYLPDSLAGSVFYKPGNNGFEKQVREIRKEKGVKKP